MPIDDMSERGWKAMGATEVNEQWRYKMIVIFTKRLLGWW